MNKSLLLTLVFTTFIALNTQAQSTNPGEGRTFSLQETIELAKDQSPLSRTARYSLQASRWRYQSFRADLLPELRATGNAPNYRRTFREFFDQTGNTQFIYSQQSNASLELSIDQPIVYTGGSLSLSTGMTRLGIFQNENTYLWSSSPLVIGYRQPLFQFNNLKWQRRLEPLRLQIAQKQYVEAIENLSLTVTQRYFDVVLAKINLDIAEFNVSVNDSIYNISQGRFNVGNIAENDLLQSELALLNSEASLTSARINYDQQLKSFRLLLGLDADTPYEIEVPDEIPIVDVNMNTAMEMALLNSSTSLSYRVAELEAQRNLDQAVKQSAFSGVVQANLGFNQTSETLADAYKDPLDQQFVTLSFQVPIFNWGKQRANVNAARNTQRQVQDDINYQQDQFELQIQNVVNEFLQLRQQALLSAKSDTIAQRRYESALNRYRVGRIDITNLFIAQNERDAARRSYIQSLRNYWISLYSLRRLTLYDFENDQMIMYDI